MYLYRFVACFQSDCCDQPHLWGQAVHAKSYKEARRKFIDEVQNEGREVFEIVEVTHGIGTVEEVRHQGVECAQCGEKITDEEDGESSCCGSVHTVCYKSHVRACRVC